MPTGRRRSNAALATPAWMAVSRGYGRGDTGAPTAGAARCGDDALTLIVSPVPQTPSPVPATAPEPGLLGAAQPLEALGEGLVGLVLVHHEEDLLKRRVAVLEVLEDGRQDRVRGLLGRDSADAAAEGGEGDGRQAVLLGEGQRRLGRRGDLLGIRLEVLAHRRGVDDVHGG